MLVVVILFVFAVGFVIGYRFRAKQDRGIMILASTYKQQNDEMLERLTELEMLLEDGEE